MLNLFFGENSTPNWFHIWHGDTKRSYWFQIASDANDTAEHLETDVYFCASLVRDSQGERQRVKAHEACGITAISLDVDCKSPDIESKKLRCPNKKVAQQWVMDNFPAPTMIIDSGHGIQPWWLFEKRPWMFVGQQVHKRAMNLAKNWVALAQQKAPWDIDSTGDLARLMRVPGTVNNKNPDKPKPVEVIYYQDVFYAPDVLEQACRTRAPMLKPARQQTPPSTVASASLTLSMDANPSAPLVAIMMATHSGFRQTMMQKRDDLKDQSQSGYDLALASICAHNEWTDQQIADLIISVRREWNAKPEKALRLDYMTNLLNIVRRSVKHDISTDEAREHAKVEEILNSGENAKELALKEIRESLCLDIKAIVRYGKERPIYTFLLDDGRQIEIGNATSLLSFNKVKTVIFSVIWKAIPTIKGDRWNALVNLFQLIAIDEDLPDDDLPSQIGEALGEYISREITSDELGELIICRDPFKMSGDEYVHAQALTTYLQYSQGIKVQSKIVRSALRMMGFSHTRMQAWINNKNIGRSYWKRSP